MKQKFRHMSVSFYFAAMQIRHPFAIRMQYLKREEGIMQKLHHNKHLRLPPIGCLWLLPSPRASQID